MATIRSRFSALLDGQDPDQLPPAPFVVADDVPALVTELRKEVSETKAEEQPEPAAESEAPVETPRAAGCCAVCMEDTELEVQLCAPDCLGAVCRACLGTQFAMVVADSYPGVLKRMLCPSCPGTRVVPSARWFPLVDQATRDRWTSLAASIVSFQCGSCHTRKSQLHELPAGEAAPEPPAELAEALAAYALGELTQQALVPQLVEAFGGAPEAVDLRRVALSLADRERRATLQSAFWYKHPKMDSLCCQRTHCWRCRSRDFHEGRTCEENSATLYRHSDILPCPACSTPLVRGDGCSSISCVCGNRFSWDTELERYRCVAFVAAHGGDEMAAGRAIIALQARGDNTEAEAGDIAAFRNQRRDVFETMEAVQRVGGGDVDRALVCVLTGSDGDNSGDLAMLRRAFPVELFVLRHGDNAAAAAAEDLADGQAPVEAVAWLGRQSEDESAAVRAAAARLTAERWSEGRAEPDETAAALWLGDMPMSTLTAVETLRYERFCEHFPERLTAGKHAVAAARLARTEAAIVAAMASADFCAEELAELEALEATAEAACPHEGLASTCSLCRAGIEQAPALEANEEVCLALCFDCFQERSTAEEVMYLRQCAVEARALLEALQRP